MAPVNPEPILGQEINLWVAVSFTGHSPVGTVRQVVGQQIWGGWEAFVNVQFHLPIQYPSEMSSRWMFQNISQGTGEAANGNWGSYGWSLKSETREVT